MKLLLTALTLLILVVVFLKPSIGVGEESSTAMDTIKEMSQTPDFHHEYTSLCVVEKATGFKWRNEKWQLINYETHQFILKNIVINEKEYDAKKWSAVPTYRR